MYVYVHTAGSTPPAQVWGPLLPRVNQFYKDARSRHRVIYNLSHNTR